MKTSGNQKFTISVKTDNFKNGHVAVQQAETTDGQPYYICEIDGKEVQLRYESKWEQIWGDLNAEQINELGNAINTHLHL